MLAADDAGERDALLGAGLALAVRRQDALRRGTGGGAVPSTSLPLHRANNSAMTGQAARTQQPEARPVDSRTAPPS